MIRQAMSREQRRLQRGDQQRIFMQLRRYFAPSSIVPPPDAGPQATGNRNTVLTAQNSANSAPTDSATIALSGGVLTWYYKTHFNNPPNVTATAVTQSGSVTELALQGPGSNVAVVILSSDNTDSRLVNLHAVGAPD